MKRKCKSSLLNTYTPCDDNETVTVSETFNRNVRKKEINKRITCGTDIENTSVHHEYTTNQF